MNRGELIELLRDETPLDSEVWLEAGGDGAVHSGSVQSWRVENGRLILSTEPDFHEFFRVEQWVDGWTASNSRGHWKDLERCPTDDEFRASAVDEKSGDRFFWDDRGELHSRIGANAGARLFRIVPIAKEA